MEKKSKWDYSRACRALGRNVVAGAKVVLVVGRNLSLSQLGAADYLTSQHGFAQK